ncbi:hypothetical protein ABS71_04360 [bacterium SCN 62-11]|nr:MAG: hypothetical protein ABS71_04360 [bacterium SCN 62-11]
MTNWHFAPGRNFECSQCARCCRGWRIHIDPQTAQTLQSSPFRKQLEVKDGRTFARKNAQEECTFLTPQRLCQLHSQPGTGAKPAGCRQFPFRLTRTPDGIFVGTSFSCPSIQSNQGEPLATYQAELESLTERLPLWGESGVPVCPSVLLDWSEYLRLEKHILERETVEIGLSEGLWALGQYALRPDRPLEGYLLQAAAALEPPDEPLMLMEHHWFHRLLAHCGEKSARAPSRKAPPAELETYLRALLHGKILINHRPLLGNLALLHLLPSFYRFWFDQSGSLDHALDLCERKIATHPNNLNELVEKMADDFRDQLDPVL